VPRWVFLGGNEALWRAGAILKLNGQVCRNKSGTLLHLGLALASQTAGMLQIVAALISVKPLVLLVTSEGLAANQTDGLHPG
jgi:urea transporter